MSTSSSSPGKGFLKIVVIGDSGCVFSRLHNVKRDLVVKTVHGTLGRVGKTSILERYANKRFSTTYKATIGADFYVRDVKVGDRVFTLQVGRPVPTMLGATRRVLEFILWLVPPFVFAPRVSVCFRADVGHRRLREISKVGLQS
jgi:hypothetical protein